MHKVVTIKRDFPYAKTTVSFEKSLAEIQALLAKFGCGRMGTMRDPRGDEILHTLIFEHHGLQYMIEFPITYIQQQSQRKQDMRISGRVVFNQVKSLLVDAEIGYLDFSQAMMRYLVLPGPQGPQTLMEYVADHREELSQGKIELKYLPPGSG